ncbi:hypothetical protein TNCV_2916951 [Trichonephila clavipes]|nr:hypothetical protein TNCV_2916951 [Trichonephila clavipes]
MRQARHLPQRWYWSIVVQVRDVIRQFTQGTPNCNTNPKANRLWYSKEPVLESSELITSRLTVNSGTRGRGRTEESGVWGSCCVPFGPCFLRRREAGVSPLPVNRLVISSADSNMDSFGIPKTVALG